MQNRFGGSIFNWTSLPTFASMLLFWLLALYVITRRPRSLVSLSAAGAMIGTPNPAMTDANGLASITAQANGQAGQYTEAATPGP